MRKRINLLALLVIAGGGALLGHPTPASATMAPGTSIGEQFGSCCYKYDGTVRVAYCCSVGGCAITAVRCAPLS